MKQTKKKNKESNEKLNKIFSYIKSFFFMDSSISSRRKSYNAIWAVIFGLSVSTIFISFYNLNPFEFLKDVFVNGLTKSQNTLAYFIIVYGIASIGVGFSFKSGLFNIGISGQMMFAGIIGIIFLEYLVPPKIGGVANFTLYDNSTAWGFLIMFVCIIAGFLLSSFAGLLKSFFKIHEVVSTILINWIIVFIGQFFFKKFSFPHPNDYDGSAFLKFDGFFGADTFYKFGIFLLLFIAFGLFIVFKFTSLGYKIKMNGINKNASSYSGVNQHLTTILSMGFSGALAGLAGFIWFLVKEGKYNVNSLSQPLLLGFDTIAISLLGQNSPIGIIFSSLFYSALQNSNVSIRLDYSSSGIVDGGLNVVIGIIIYFAAISNSLSQFRPLHKIIYWVGSWSQKRFVNQYKEIHEKDLLHKKESQELLKKARLQNHKNKERYKYLLWKIKTCEKDVLLNVGSNVKNLSSKDIETLFQNAAQEKYRLNKQLEKIGFFEIKDIKNINYAEKEHSRTKLQKKQKEAFLKFNFWIKEIPLFTKLKNKNLINKIEKHFIKEKEFLNKELEQKRIDISQYNANLNKNQKLENDWLSICKNYKKGTFKKLTKSLFKDQKQEYFDIYFNKKIQINNLLEVN